MPGDWMSMPGSDALLAPLASPLADRRYLWLRITLTTSDPSVSPVLLQARAATEAEDLREHLPATYRRNDSTETLKHMLQMVRGEFFDVEEQTDALARLSHPEFATATMLPWLAQWLGLELPAIADDDERRDIIARAIGMYARRGTPASIADFVEMHTGVRPAIIEEFTRRRLWVLGESSELGFDTQLPPLDPLGMVVPDEQSAQGCCPMSEGEPVIGRAVVGSSGPLASHQIGLPLFAEEAYRFCVVVDAYRVSSEDTLRELCRIVDREKPAHTDYRIDIVAPELRIGLQAMVGIDTIVGGSEPAWRLEQRQLGQTAYLVPPDDASRAGETWLDGSLQLN
jgi:phage tail-like protein